jgi:3-methylcrotonyl-CoA carboxylase beta subunit
VFPDKYLAGRNFRNQSIMSKMGVKQLSLVLGHCTAGAAYIPDLLLRRGTGHLGRGDPVGTGGGGWNRARNDC